MGEGEIEYSKAMLDNRDWSEYFERFGYAQSPGVLRIGIVVFSFLFKHPFKYPNHSQIVYLIIIKHNV